MMEGRLIEIEGRLAAANNLGQRERDPLGRQVLVGLSAPETAEFCALLAQVTAGRECGDFERLTALLHQHVDAIIEAERQRG